MLSAVRQALHDVIEESGGVLCEVGGLGQKLRSGKTVHGLEYTLRNPDGTPPELPGKCSLRIWVFGKKSLPWAQSPVTSMGVAFGKSQRPQLVEEACQQAFGVGLDQLSRLLTPFGSRKPKKCQIKCTATDRAVDFVRWLLDRWNACWHGDELSSAPLAPPAERPRNPIWPMLIPLLAMLVLAIVFFLVFLWLRRAS